MPTTVTISTITDPVDASNVTAGTATGTTDTDTNTVVVAVSDGATTVTGGATVTPVTGAWSVGSLNLTTLDDGLVTWSATATALDTSKAFAATSGEKRVATDYVATADLKSRLSITDSADDTYLASCITAASRAIDTYCGRYFSTDSSTSSRVVGYSGPVRVVDPYVAFVHDVSTTSGLVVETDISDAATYTTVWAGTDYQLEPLGQIDGGLTNVPYTLLRAVGNHTFPLGHDHPPLRVTAKWGWPTTPEPVVHAAYIIATDLYKLKDVAFGATSTMTEFGPLRVSSAVSRAAAVLLSPYRRAAVLVA